MSAISTSSGSKDPNEYHPRLDCDALKYFIERQPAAVIREHVTLEELRKCVPLLDLDDHIAYVWDKLLTSDDSGRGATTTLAEMKQVANEAQKEPVTYEVGAQLLQAICEHNTTEYLVPFYQWIHRTKDSQPLAPPPLVAARMHHAIDTALARTTLGVHELKLAYQLALHRRTALWTDKCESPNLSIKADYSLRKTIQQCGDVCVVRVREDLGL